MLHDSRVRQAKCALGIMLGIVIIIMTIIIITNYVPFEVTETKEYIVQPGDSLWSIVVNECPSDDYGINQIINWIKEENGCSNAIYPNQKLVIPVFSR